MSLDVYLNMKGAETRHTGTGVFIREDGGNRELSVEEVKERFPTYEPVIAQAAEPTDEVYSANITHNLNKMAGEAGIYEACWRPDEIGVTKAGQLVPLLKTGLEKLRADPEHFKQFNPSNGWGTYEGLVRWVQSYLDACEQWPEAEVTVSR